jgi:hypothetical protein
MPPRGKPRQQGHSDISITAIQRHKVINPASTAPAATFTAVIADLTSVSPSIERPECVGVALISKHSSGVSYSLARTLSCRPNSLAGFRNVGAAVDQGANIEGAYQRLVGCPALAGSEPKELPRSEKRWRLMKWQE